MKQIYCDNSATTPLDIKVAELMSEVQRTTFGNPSSIHRFGQEAKVIIEQARRHISSTLNISPRELVFTGGGSESNNQALIGLLKDGDHLITSTIEHPSVLKPAISLKNIGVEITYITPDKMGMISPELIQAEIKENTKLISIMFANNEIGNINPVKKIGELAREHGLIFHTDAVQAFGKVPIDPEDMSIDLLSISAHKLHGPKGVGALYIKNGIELNPLIAGGGQEQSLRAGTENIAGIAGFGLAAEIAQLKLESCSNHSTFLAETFLKGLINNNIAYQRNGINTLPGVLSITFPGVDGHNLLMNLDMQGIAISYGSACGSGSAKPSDVLFQIGMDEESAKSTVRISFGRENSMDDIEYFIEVISKLIPKMRNNRINA